LYFGQGADLLHLNLVQTGHVSDVVDGVHGGILLGIVVNFLQMQTGVAWSFNLVHNVLHRCKLLQRVTEKTMKHHKYHQHYQVRAAKLHARAEAALDLITALVIGIGLAAALFYGWSA